MPDAGSKKRPTQQTGSGKLSKKGISVEDIPVIETVTVIDASCAENEEDVTKPCEPLSPIPEPVKDIMRTEPLLYPVIIDKYDGETDEYGFYHGEGIAHLKDGMVYSGMFERGKMHGHGLFTWADGTTYSGDFMHNVISGKGLYCWPDGSSYDGEVLNGLRHGHGVFKCPDMKAYTGQWKQGKRHGKGVLCYDPLKTSYYDGEWVENEKHGYGFRRFSSRNVYKGYWEKNMRNGEGVMHWYTRGEEYSGHWVNGIQNGHGTYTWYLKRVRNSQYPLRNQYIGDFVNGERHGNGIFHYASGAMYVGKWKNNMKEGEGKFTFKNGSVFTGLFHNDRMTDFPDLILPRMMTPDIAESGIPVKSSMSLKSRSAFGFHRNSVDPILDVDLDDIFINYEYNLEQQQEEAEKIMRTILRYATKLKNIYKIYSCLGVDFSLDNTFVMNKCQFSRLLKDYGIHRYGITLAQMERYLEREITMNSCQKKMFIRDFLNNLVNISYLMFRGAVGESASAISTSFDKLICHMMRNEKVEVQGHIYKSINHAQNVLKYANEIFELYFYFATLYCKDNDATLRLHDVLLIFKEMDLVNQSFNATELVKILTEEERDEEGYYNLDKEITPFEFLEFVVGSANVFVTDELLEKHCPTHVLPISLLNVTCDDSRNVDDVGEKIEESSSSEPVSTDFSGESFIKFESTEPLSISPAKPMKSNVRIGKKVASTNEKKMEKESSNGQLKTKREMASKLGKKASSTKMDVGKTKSPKSIVSPEVDVSAGGPIVADESVDSTVEHIPSLGDDIIVPSNTDLTPESSLDAEHSKKGDEEQEEIVVEKIESFEVWSLRLKLFLNEYLFPRYSKRKTLEEMLKISHVQKH